MQEQDVDQVTNNRPSQRQPWKVFLCLIGVALLLNVTLASAALNYLVPKVVDHKQVIVARMDWYLHSGQLQADARSLAAAFDYIMAADSDAASITNLANLPVAENAAPSAPKS